MRGYYDLYEYASNSDLGVLQSLLRGEDVGAGPSDALQGIFDYGNLVDARITERHKINELTGTLTEGSRTIQFTDAQMKQAALMQQAFDADPDLRAMFANMQWQHVILKQRFRIEHDGMEWHMRARCKFDGLDKKHSLGGDIKTTAATTNAQFLQAFYHFDYDRQCAWYMDLAGIDRMIYAGLSKKKKVGGLPAVFKHCVKRGDECYMSGLAKYQKLGFKYYFFIQQLMDHVQTN